MAESRTIYSSRKLIQQTIAMENFDDAFYVVDVEDIIEKHNRWLSKMPRIRPYYAVKCNSTPVVLEILAALGLGFDCASKNEIADVLSIGVSPKRIIYANPCKSKCHVKYAMKENVDLMTFDNEEELYKIADIAPNARLVIRIKADDSHSKYHLGRKFGVDMENVPALLKLARNLKLNVVGVSFHVGSECDSCKPFEVSIKDAANVFRVAETIGYNMNILDIGGGFPGNSGPKNESLYDQICTLVNTSIDKYFPPEMNVDIIAEPGRYFVVSAFTLTACVIGKQKDFVNDKLQMTYYVNDGLFGSFANTRFGDEIVTPIPQIYKESNRPKFNSIIWGQTCKDDCIRKDIVMSELNMGEWVSFADMGAYSIVLYTNFNGFQLPMLKCNVSETAINFLMKLPGWQRLVKHLSSC